MEKKYLQAKEVHLLVLQNLYKIATSDKKTRNSFLNLSYPNIIHAHNPSTVIHILFQILLLLDNNNNQWYSNENSKELHQITEEASKRTRWCTCSRSLDTLTKNIQPIKCKLLLSVYSQLCVVQYEESGRWSLIWVKVCLNYQFPKHCSQTLFRAGWEN